MQMKRFSAEVEFSLLELRRYYRDIATPKRRLILVIYNGQAGDVPFMPRPADNYTHSQFELVDSDNQGETVQCKHCRNWTGSVKVLNRKKDHLMRCPQYAQWRAAGNGQDLAPPNKYNKRDSTNSWRQYDGEDGGIYGGYDFTPPILYRGKNVNVGRYFDEWTDETGGQKCTRVRCRACGFMRAKNTTRQVEHLTHCTDFLDSPEGHDALTRGEIEAIPPVPPPANMISTFPDRLPNSSMRMNGPSPSQGRPGSRNPTMPPPKGAPSLANHLLNRNPDRVKIASQQQFLSHAGCGTLSASALGHWLGQNAHFTRAMVSFVGSLIGKVRLPETRDTRQHSLYRTMDLLISAVGNLRKELSFLEETRQKYHLEPDNEPISPILKAYVDLLSSVADPRASLLEGLVVLWATEHFHSLSWQYASTFVHTMPSSNYSIPSYLAPNQNPWSTFASDTPAAAGLNGGSGGNDTQINALRDALIPNWSSRDFIKFVEACKAIVDELANAQTTGSGKEELERCEMQFAQVLFLWERTWPEVDGMGQRKGEGIGVEDGGRGNGNHGVNVRNGNGIVVVQGGNGGGGLKGGNLHGVGAEGELIRRLNHQASSGQRIGDQGGDEEEEEEEEEGEGDDEHELGGTGLDPVDSPYGGTGLGVVAAANRV